MLWSFSPWSPRSSGEGSFEGVECRLAEAEGHLAVHVKYKSVIAAAPTLTSTTSQGYPLTPSMYIINPLDTKNLPTDVAYSPGMAVHSSAAAAAVTRTNTTIIISQLDQWTRTRLSTNSRFT